MQKRLVKTGMKVIPFQKTPKHWEEDFEEYINSGTDIPAFFKDNGFLYVVGFDQSERAFILGMSTYEEDGGDYFEHNDFEPYDKIELSDIDTPVINIDKVIESFNNLGIAIKNTDGTFRRFNDVMQDLSDMWEGLED